MGFKDDFKALKRQAEDLGKRADKRGTEIAEKYDLALFEVANEVGVYDTFSDMLEQPFNEGGDWQSLEDAFASLDNGDFETEAKNLRDDADAE